MMNRPPLSPRTVRGWCVVTKTGVPLLETVRPLRRQAINAYTLNQSGFGNYAYDRETIGVQVVRCSITTEVSDDTETLPCAFKRGRKRETCGGSPGVQGTGMGYYYARCKRCRKFVTGAETREGALGEWNRWMRMEST